MFTLYYETNAESNLTINVHVNCILCYKNIELFTILFIFIFVNFSSRGKKSGGHGRGKYQGPQGQTTSRVRSGGQQQVPLEETSRQF